MLYAKVVDGAVVKYPYNFNDLKRDNPRVSFPRNVAAIDLAAYNVVGVTELPEPVYDRTTQTVEAGVPTENAGEWTIQSVVVPLSAEEIARLAKQAKNAAERAELETDTQVKNLFSKDANQINTYIDNNVTNLAEAKAVLKILARASAVLANQTL